MGLLDVRAERLATPKNLQSGDKVVVEAVIVAVGREHLGFPLAAVNVTLKTPKVARLPGLPVWLPGVIPLRGDSVSLVDLSALLEIDSAGRREMTVVVEHPMGKLGLLVDAIIETRTIVEGEVSSQAAHPARLATWPILITTRDLVSILDIERLYRDPRLRIAE